MSFSYHQFLFIFCFWCWMTARRAFLTFVRTNVPKLKGNCSTKNLFRTRPSLDNLIKCCLLGLGKAGLPVSAAVIASKRPTSEPAALFSLCSDVQSWIAFLGTELDLSLEQGSPTWRNSKVSTESTQIPFSLLLAKQGVYSPLAGKG